MVPQLFFFLEAPLRRRQQQEQSTIVLLVYLNFKLILAVITHSLIHLHIYTYVCLSIFINRHFISM